jgi:tyrosyl-tRNA synthetase
LTESGARNPRDVKVELAKHIITDFHSKAEADAAEEEFNRIFKRKEAPEEIETVEIKAGSLQLAQFLAKSGLAASVAEARRLIEQGGVRVSGVRQTEPNVLVAVKTGDDFILQVGKRRFLRVRGK